jgi:hypothetical protein
MMIVLGYGDNMNGNMSGYEVMFQAIAVKEAEKALLLGGKGRKKFLALFLTPQILHLLKHSTQKISTIGQMSRFEKEGLELYLMKPAALDSQSHKPGF